MAEVAGLQAFASQLFSDLRDGGARFAVVAGFAVSVRSEPRFTQDIDVAVAARTDAEAEALVGHLQARGYQVFMVLEQQAVGRMATSSVAFLHAPRPPQVRRPCEAQRHGHHRNGRNQDIIKKPEDGWRPQVAE